LGIVCLLLVGTIAIEAQVPTPRSTPCPRGETSPSPGPSAKIWEDKAAALRHIDANGIPNHCVDQSYHTPIKAQNYHFKVPLNPTPAGTTTKVTICPTPFSTPPQRFGVALNGVVFDPEDVAIWLETEPKCAGTTPTPPGKTFTDCIDNVAVKTAADCSYVRWQVDPEEKVVDLSSIMCCSKAELDMDNHIAHTQNTGIYHYHTLTAETAAAIAGVTKTSLGSGMTLVGWAFDGSPIYWKYGELKRGDKPITMKSWWTLKKARKGGGDPVPDVKKFPLGTFVNDYEYAKGTGDGALDECNGKVCYSPDFDKIIYCYFITEEFPYIPRCFRGTPTEK